MIEKIAFWFGYALGLSIGVIVAAWIFFVPAKASDYQLPSEVTPALRSACESDFKRLCHVPGKIPTKYEVWSCIQSTWNRITKRCQVELKVAGLAP